MQVSQAQGEAGGREVSEQKTYRLVTAKLRVQRGPGNPDLVVARPLKPGDSNQRVFTDSDENPTLVTFDDLCQVDIDNLLAVGAIAEYTPPKPVREVKA